MSAPTPRARENGFTLVEIMVSVVLLSVASVIVGKQMLQAAQAARTNGTAVYQTAAITARVSRLAAIPFDLLPTGTSCDTVAAAPFPHTACTTVTNVSTKVRRVTVVVTPSGTTLPPPDTTVVLRTMTTTGQPLNN